MRKNILDFAKSQIGTIEIPVNKVKYNEWYGNGLENGGSWAPWCCTFISYVFYFAGHALPKIDNIEGFMNIRTALRYAKRHNYLITFNEIKAGDIVALDFGLDGLADHCGIFSHWQGKKLVIIEGNTSAGKIGSQANGGQVAIRKRSKKYVAGIISANIANGI